MKIYESAVRKPISTILLFVGVMVFGLFSLMNLAVDQYLRDRDTPDLGDHDVSGRQRRRHRDQHHPCAGGQPQHGEQPQETDLQVAGQRLDDHRRVRIRLRPERGGQRNPRRGVARAVAAARRHRLSDDLQVLDLDDPRDDACRHGRGELSGAEQDSRRQVGQRAQPRRRRGRRVDHRRTRTRGAGQRRPRQTGGLQPHGRAAGADHRRRERQHPQRHDRRGQQHLQHQGRRRVQTLGRAAQGRGVERRGPHGETFGRGPDPRYARKSHDGRTRQRPAGRARDVPETVGRQHREYRPRNPSRACRRFRKPSRRMSRWS